MSERIVTLRNPQHCDLCQQKICTGEKARIVKDDFGQFVWFEHVRCPHPTAVNTVPRKMMFV